MFLSHIYAGCVNIEEYSGGEKQTSIQVKVDAVEQYQNKAGNAC